jgi:hypothetical protein
MSHQPEELSGNEPADVSPVHSLAARYGRRALILGAAAAGAGVAADLVAGGTAEAAPDTSAAVLLGKFNSANSSTIVGTKRANGLVGQTHAKGFSGVAGLDFNTAHGSNGVYGQTYHGYGVFGIGIGGGHGVGAHSNTSGFDAVQAIDTASSGGTALYGASAHGFALRTAGKIKMSTSGVAVVPAGQRSATFACGGMTASSMVFATIQQAQSGVHIEGAEAGEESFMLTLSKGAAAPVRVAWFVLD